jgi:hypothetical protein
MKTTTDLLTGLPFRWNTTAIAKDDNGRRVIVPARCTERLFVHLHPSRTPAPLLKQLNEEKLK